MPRCSTRSTRSSPRSVWPTRHDRSQGAVSSKVPPIETGMPPATGA
jgi:hypothetical protein